MKHAYLIIVHNEPNVLHRLIDALDDERNDIYLHIDKKASFDGRDIKTEKSKLYLLKNRIDARWGDFSLVEVELALFKEAYQKREYTYYHLLSGVDFPIKTQDYIHSYCQSHAGTEFIGFSQNATAKELRWRSQHYFIFAKDFNKSSIVKRVLRGCFVKIQTFVGYRRVREEVKKGSQWCSVTHDFVSYFLSCEAYIRKYFNHTYCPDELVIQTLCWNSKFKYRVYSQTDEFIGCKRFIKWVDGTLQPLMMADVPDMMRSGCWFARKFSNSSLCILDSILSENMKINIQ